MPLANDPHNRSEDNPAAVLLAEIAKNIEAQQPKKAETRTETEKAAT